MTEILKFACIASNCGRRFNTEEELNRHYDLRHKKEKEEASMENIIKQISKPKLNVQEKHHYLQPISKKSSKTNMNNNINKEKEKEKEKKDNKNNKEILEEEINIQNIPFSREAKEKKLLDNLIGQINNLENYLEKDYEFHKEFKLPKVPDYDNMYDSDEDKNEKEKKKEKENESIYEINEEMIFNNNVINDNDFEVDKYKKIHKINLSNKNIKNFKNNKNIPFEKLQELYILNLSNNLISEANDISYIENLRELYLQNNKLIEIKFCENLPNLVIIDLENNNIKTITSLNICTKLEILKICNNNITYLNSTLKIFNNLKNLKELTIKQNPFLDELFSYREYFISNYKNIQNFDGEDIDEEKRNKAQIYYKENNPIYKKVTERPMSSRLEINKIKKNNILEESNSSEDNDDDIFCSNNNSIVMAKTQTEFRNKDKLNIDKINNNNYKKDEDKEEMKLKMIIEEQNNIIEKLRSELENSSRLNKVYEIQIDKYNHELNKNNNDNINGKVDKETEKIKNEIEMWKKQYFYLLEKNETKGIKFSNDLFDMNKKGKKDNDTKVDIIERPQTAHIRSNLTRNFEKLYEEINILKGKNEIKDVLKEEDEEEEEKEEEIEEEKEGEEKGEEEKDEEKEEENDDDNNNKEDIEDEIPDDEIEEMFRKSYQDIQKMRQDLHEINNNMNKNIITDNKIKKDSMDLLLNKNKKSNKPSLKPILKKKEDNNNILRNDKNNKIFGRQGNILSLNNKNKIMNENDKNSASQRYNEILYKLKK